MITGPADQHPLARLIDKYGCRIGRSVIQRSPLFLACGDIQRDNTSAIAAAVRRQELDPPVRPEIWEQVQSETDNCLGPRCGDFKECFYQSARRLHHAGEFSRRGRSR